MNEQLIHIDYKQWKLEVSCASEHHGNVSVVCLHGLQSNKDAFSSVVELCAGKGFSTVGIDFIGFGKSSKPEDFSYLLEDQAAVVDHVISELRLQKFFLIGHSMGGMVGTLLLKEWEQQLLGFVNMEGNFVFDDCGASLPVSEVSFEEFSTKIYPALKAELSTSKEPSAALRRRWLESTPNYSFYGASKAIVEHSRDEKLIPLFVQSPVRKLFVYGERNKRKRDILPQSVPCAEVPNAGHFMLADNPKDTLKIIGDFLS
jgi:pimeloyl-ACP methyl ester carboxylesterase